MREQTNPLGSVTSILGLRWFCCHERCRNFSVRFHLVIMDFPTTTVAMEIGQPETHKHGRWQRDVRNERKRGPIPVSGIRLKIDQTPRMSNVSMSHTGTRLGWRKGILTLEYLLVLVVPGRILLLPLVCFISNRASFCFTSFPWVCRVICRVWLLDDSNAVPLGTYCTVHPLKISQILLHYTDI